MIEKIRSNRIGKGKEDVAKLKQIEIDRSLEVVR
jgi:hypothetical protein